LVDCQGENLLGNFTPITDFRLKCCIEEQKFENNISGRNVQGKEFGASPEFHKLVFGG
jgi:hypothetical protein